MVLKIELKTYEKLILGNALISNDSDRIRFFISGDVPILREKYVITQKEVDTPCKSVYYTIQEMYLAKDAKEFHKKYFRQIREILYAAPSLALTVDKINAFISGGDYYNALKSGITLISKENELLKKAKPTKATEKHK